MLKSARVIKYLIIFLNSGCRFETSGYVNPIWYDTKKSRNTEKKCLHDQKSFHWLFINFKYGHFGISFICIPLMVHALQHFFCRNFKILLLALRRNFSAAKNSQFLHACPHAPVGIISNLNVGICLVGFAATHVSVHELVMGWPIEQKVYFEAISHT